MPFIQLILLWAALAGSLTLQKNHEIDEKDEAFQASLFEGMSDEYHGQVDREARIEKLLARVPLGELTEDAWTRMLIELTSTYSEKEIGELFMKAYRYGKALHGMKQDPDSEFALQSIHFKRAADTIAYKRLGRLDRAWYKVKKCLRSYATPSLTSLSTGFVFLNLGMMYVMAKYSLYPPVKESDEELALLRKLELWQSNGACSWNFYWDQRQMIRNIHYQKLRERDDCLRFEGEVIGYSLGLTLGMHLAEIMRLLSENDEELEVPDIKHFPVVAAYTASLGSVVGVYWWQAFVDWFS